MNKFKTESVKNFKGDSYEDIIDNNFEIANSQFSALVQFTKTNESMLKSKLRNAKTEKRKVLFPGKPITDADQYAKSVLDAEKVIISIEEEIEAVKKAGKFYQETLDEINEE